MIYYMHGDLLKSSVQALVNTVNCVGTMGKGIALSFKKCFPNNFKEYKLACDKKKIHPGTMFVYSMNSLFDTQYIINFPTKNHWREKSKLSYITEGLQDLAHVIKKNHISSIAIPPLGCGNGGLNWCEVKPLIEQYLGDLDCDIHVYEPCSNTSCYMYKEMNGKQASLLCAMNVYVQPQLGELSRLEVQKLAYFLQVLGVPLELNFVKGLCGPFSKQLSNVLTNFEYNYYIEDDVHDDSPETNEIKLNELKLAEAKRIVESDPDLVQAMSRLKNLIFRFETPYGLELLSTVHWITQEFPDLANNLDFITEKVRTWNHRKRVMFKAYHVKMAYKKLNEMQLIDMS